MKATLIVRYESQRKAAIKWLEEAELPLMLEAGPVTITRTEAQNRTIHHIFNVLSNITGYAPGEIKALMKELYLLGSPTSETTVEEASEMIERLLALLAEHGFVVVLPIGLLEEASGNRGN